MNTIFYVSITVAVIIEVICVFCFLRNLRASGRRKKECLNSIEKQRHEAKVIREKMPEIKLNNEGESIDQNIAALIESGDISVNKIVWSEIYEG